MSQNYKDTLNLPKTDFPMKANLATREPEMLKQWNDAGLYAQIQAARATVELDPSAAPSVSELNLSHRVPRT